MTPEPDFIAARWRVSKRILFKSWRVRGRAELGGSSLFSVILLLMFLSQPCLADPKSQKLEHPKSTKWQRLPLPESRWPGVNQIAMERGGTLWALANNEVYYWTGKEMRSPEGEKLRSGMYLARLLGGQDRELYLSQAGAKDQGAIYRLSDGVAHYVTDFHYEVSHEQPGLYVSPRGHILNWGSKFLSVYVDGEWKKHEAVLDIRGVRVLESHDKVYVIHRHNLYVVDEDGSVRKCELEMFTGTIQLASTPRVVAWGKDRIFMQCKGLRRLLAFDTNTGKHVNVDNLDRELQGRSLVDFFARPDGSLWLRSQKSSDCAYYAMSYGGKVSRVEGTEELAQLPLRHMQRPLQSSDGAVWLATEDGSIIRYHKGKLRRFNWEDGFSIGKCSPRLEDRKGTIYVASHEAIAVWRPDAADRPLPKWVDVWQEFSLATYHPIRDSRGNVWMFLSDHPGQISRWDGHRWHHQPLAAESIYRGMADDQGNLLLEDSKNCFYVSPNGVVKFPDTKAALISAQARGVKRMDTDSSFQGCEFLEGGRIWFGYHNRNLVHYYDGKRWSEYSLRDDIYYLHKSVEHGVLIRTQGGKFYKHEDGELQLVGKLGLESQRLWSAKLFQPFESALLEKYPRDFVAVKGRTAAVSVRQKTADGMTKNVLVMGDPLPQHTSTLTRAWKHGFWTDYQAAPIYRIWGNRVIQCDWHGTPMLSRWYEIRQMIEDRAGNLWTFAAGYSPQQVFMKRMDDFRLTASYDGDKRIAVTADPSWHGDYVPRVFWRADDGLWQGGEPVNEIVVDAKNATQIEIVAIDRQGGTTKPLRIKLQADKTSPTNKPSGR